MRTKQITRFGTKSDRKLRITCEDQNGSKFGATSVDDAIKRCLEYCSDDRKAVFRIYQVDPLNPWPGFLVGWVCGTKFHEFK